MLALIPYRRYESWLDRFDEGSLVDRFFDDFETFARDEGGGLLPAFDISETDENIVLKADLPGIDIKNLDIDVKDNVLTLKGEKKEECEDKKEKYYRVERRFGSFCRSFSLPDTVNAEGIEATYKDGVLRLTIPKTEKAKPRKIEVQHH